MSRRAQLGAVATAATLVLGVGGISAGSAVSAPNALVKAKATPVLKVTIRKSSLTVSRHSFVAGRIDLRIKSVGAEREFAIAKFKKGYSFAKLRADEIQFNKDAGPNGESKAGIRLLDHALARTTFYGGLDATVGQKESGSVVLPKAGTYYVWNDTDVPKDAVKLTVTGPAVHRPAPKSTATVTGKSDDRFGGAKKLPAKGTITFKDTTSGSKKSPHLWDLLHVKAGTTRKQVLTALESSSGPPSFILKGSAGIDAINPGVSETVRYNLPKGTYAELCFFPDPKTGVPHAFMGMIRIVTLTK
jgi:hypothetical protein